MAFLCCFLEHLKNACWESDQVRESENLRRWVGIVCLTLSASPFFTISINIPPFFLLVNLHILHSHRSSQSLSVCRIFVQPNVDVSWTLKWMRPYLQSKNQNSLCPVISECCCEHNYNQDYGISSLNARAGQFETGAFLNPLPLLPVAISHNRSIIVWLALSCPRAAKVNFFLPTWATSTNNAPSCLNAP